jgi:hypothetical protein
LQKFIAIEIASFVASFDEHAAGCIHYVDCKCNVLIDVVEGSACAI